MRYLVSYDIPDDQRRNRLAKTLLDFGDRVQCAAVSEDGRTSRPCDRGEGGQRENLCYLRRM